MERTNRPVIRLRVAFIALALGGCGGVPNGTPDMTATPAASACSGGPNSQVPGECDRSLGCPDWNACNWCNCAREDAGGVICTEVACGVFDDAGMPVSSDGGFLVRQPQYCNASRDCPPGTVCIYEPGCPGTHGLCTLKMLCDIGPLPGSEICDCDGNTVKVDVECGVLQPYRSYGPCP